MILPQINLKIRSDSSKFIIQFNISYVIPMSFVHNLYVIRMSLVCIRMSSVCHSYVLVCHSYVVVCHPHVTRMWFYYEPAHGKTTYEWHMNDTGVHTSDIRMTYKYIQVTYGWHARIYEWHTNDIRVHACDIRMRYGPNENKS